MAVKIGIVLPTFYGGAYSDHEPSLARLIQFGREVERLGFDGLWVIEHLVVAPPVYQTAWLEPLTVLSAMAAVTTRVRLGTSILVLPIRTPAILAKTAGTLDYISGGRVTLGMGVGWWDQEFEVCGIPKKARGRRMEEHLEVLHTLFAGPNATYQGPTYAFRNVTIEPRPIQKPRIPIWIAGGSAAGQAHTVYAPKTEHVLRRIAKYGDGWISRAVTSVELMAKDWAEMLGYAKEFGREASEFTFAHINFVFLTSERDTSKDEARQRFSKISSLPFQDIVAEYMVGTKAEVLDRLDRLVDIGVRYFILWPTGFDYPLLEFLANVVLPRYARVDQTRPT
jgi:alkanesulfonate monooxygenase